jgi:hypothetical protein
LSPQVKWRENVASARNFIEGNGSVQGYPANKAKAERIAKGESPDAVLGGDKVRSFFANLIGSRVAVTVDVWAQRAATGRDLPPPKGRRYRQVARAYTDAAELCCEHARDFQAIVWLATRPAAEHERDVAAIA